MKTSLFVGVLLAAVAASEALAFPLPRAFPTVVFEGPAGSIGSEWISIRKHFLGERFLMDLTLVELRTNGDEVSVGAQQVAQAAASGMRSPGVTTSAIARMVL